MASTTSLVHIDMNGNEIQNVIAQNLAAVPSTNAGTGRFYFNTIDDTLYVKTSTGWKDGLSQGRIYSFDTDSFTNNNDYITLNIATGSTLGGVKINGNHLTIDSTTGVVSVDEASTTQKGVIEIATDSEASTGTSEVLAINPKQLATAITGLIKLTSLSIASGSTNYLGYDNTTGQFSAKVDTTVGTVSTNLVTSGAVNTALGYKLDKKPDGTNDLIDSDNKVAMTYLPDVIIGQMLYAGTFAPSTAVATLSDNAKIKLGTTASTITLTNDTTAITGYEANEGNYYIASADGSFAGISFLVGDWLLSTGSGWTKIDNTDAVTGVKGNAESSYRIGNVNITIDNVAPDQTGNSGKFLTTNGTTVSWGTAVTPDGTQTLTNKTIDADDNTISDLTTSNLKSGTLQTTVRDSSTATDTTLVSEKAVRTAVDNAASAVQTKLLIVSNPALTASSGQCSWVINLSSYSTYYISGVRVYDSNDKEIISSQTLADGASVTIVLNSTSNIAANTYTARITLIPSGSVITG